MILSCYIKVCKVKTEKLTRLHSYNMPTHLIVWGVTMNHRLNIFSEPLSLNRLISIVSSLICLMFMSCGGGKNKTSQSKDEIRFDTSKIDAFERSTVNVITKSQEGGSPVLSATTEEDLNSVLNHCGVSDLANKEKVIFSSQMEYTYTRKIHSGIAIAYVPITSTLNLTGTLATTTLDVGVKVGAVRGESVLGPVTDLNPILQQAEELARKFRGPAISVMKAPGANKESQWAGLVCNIAAYKLINKREGYDTEVEISPQFLPNVSPLASRERLDKEIPHFRTFGPLKVKILRTNHPVLKGLSEVSGNITVERIDPKQRLGQKIDGAKREIEGDTAFRITNNFKSDEVTLALGFHLWTEYYIDHSQAAFSAVVANVGDDDIMYFIGNYVGDKGGDTLVDVPKYDPQIKNLITTSCINCHNANQKGSDLHLTDYAKVKAAGPKILEMVSKGLMPKEESEKLKPAQVDMVRRWAESGFQ